MNKRAMRRASLVMLAMMPNVTYVAHAEENAPLTPTSAWKISSESYACHLERSFGDGTQPIELQLRRQVTMGALRWTILFPSQGTRSVRVVGRVEKWPQQDNSNFDGARGAISGSGQNYLVWRHC